MNIKTRLNVLEQIYKIYDDFIRTIAFVCKKKCATCCTHNVTLTTLEGYQIVDYLLSNQKASIFQLIPGALPVRRFCPQITTNKLADLCAQEKEFPEERNNFREGVCALLTDKLCPIYPVRPFGCRCLVSSQRCENKGYAQVDDFVLTVNTLFLQVIEHVDSNGLSGNLVDVLLYLEPHTNRLYYENNKLQPESSLIKNQALKILMIPPEHKDKIQPILNLLKQIPGEQQ